MNKDVHTEHCCKVHGCKYGYDFDPEYNRCSVTNGHKLQSRLCEYCIELRENGMRPYEDIPSIDKEPGWFTVSETQIAPYNLGANAKCAITRLALLRLAGGEERYQAMLREMYDNGSALLSTWFPRDRSF